MNVFCSIFSQSNVQTIVNIAGSDPHDSHGSRCGRHDRDVLGLRGDGPGNLELWRQFTHHNVPADTFQQQVKRACEELKKK